MFWEHADTTNPLVHDLGRFQDGKPWRLVKHESKVLSAWERVLKCGTIGMQEVYEPEGLARDITKECRSEKSYDSMMISSEFFGEAPGCVGQPTFEAPIVTAVEASLVAMTTER